MGIALEPADGAASPTSNGFVLLPRTCPAARVQTAACSMQTTLCALMGQGKVCSWGALTAGDFPTQPGLTKSCLMLELLGIK